MATPDFYAKALDKKSRPQDDFYQYANGPWLKANPIPATHTAWSSFGVLREETDERLKGILLKLASAKRLDAEQEKLVAYWRVAMDERKAEELGTDPLMEELARIDAIESRDELVPAVARLHNLGVNVFWDYVIDADRKRNDVNAIHLWQNGLGLPDREYYVKKDARSARTREGYLKAVARMMRIAGWSAKDAASVADAVLRIETRLAKASMTGAEQRDVEATYHKASINKLAKEAPLDWKGYLLALGIPEEHARTVIYGQPRFMTESAAILGRSHIEEIKAYLSWQCVLAAAPYLNEALGQASFAFFAKELSGQKERKPRWKRAIAEIDDEIGFLLGKEYARAYFPAAAKKRIDSLIDDLFATYRARMSALPWMSVKTMAKAIEKLDAIRRKVGYPDKWQSYASFKPDDTSYLHMHWAAVRYHVRRGIARLGKPVDRSRWGMRPHTVNAYCDFVFNEIAFPAGILQKPFYDKDWSDALNYGAIGSVIGHELTHAFDDQGSRFDKQGNQRSWWTAADRKRFGEQAEALVRQYGEQVIVDDIRCDGQLTLGENIADIGGVAIAYEALSRKLAGRMDARSGGYTVAQQFFIAYAQTENGVYRDGEARRRAVIDRHAPSRLRVNVVLSNLDEFHEAFDIRPGDRMYRAPEERVRIW